MSSRGCLCGIADGPQSIYGLACMGLYIYVKVSNLDILGRPVLKLDSCYLKVGRNLYASP